jgi:hypothetical protein
MSEFFLVIAMLAVGFVGGFLAALIWEAENKK